MNLADLFDLRGLNADELRAALIELCERGLLTCTRGNPGDDGATYAVAWYPLDHPEDYPLSVQELHAENMRRFENSGSRHD